MHPRAEALTHSPALWGLYTACAAFVGVVAATVGWNAYEHRADIVRWLKP
jgi:hypothetical protein